jgi:hypothetical protein
MAAAQLLDRVGYGIEISPGYCDIVLSRLAALVSVDPTLVETNERMSEVAARRGNDPTPAPRARKGRAKADKQVFAGGVK